MQKPHVLGLILAATFTLSAIAGCNTPAPGQSNAAVSGQSDNRTTTAAALSEDQEMDDYDVVAGQESNAYNVLMVGQPKPKPGEVAITATVDAEAAAGRGKAESKAEARGEVRAAAFKGRLKEELRTKIKDQLTKKAVKVKTRVAKFKKSADKLHDKAKNAPWVDNGDGTETKTFTVDVQKTVNGEVATRKCDMTRTRNKETKDLIGSVVKFEMTLKGETRTSTRTKTLNDDGTYTVVFHSEHTFKDGTKRVADWTKTIAVDGKVTGTGTIVVTDGTGKETKRVTIALKGTDEDCVAEAAGETITPAAPEPDAETPATASPSPSPSASATVEAETTATATAS